jgi:hypothetical protein
MYLLQELGNGIGHTNAYRRVEPVASVIGEKLVGSRSSAAQGRTVGHGLLAARVRMVSDRRIARQTFHQAKERKLVTS